MCGYPKIALGLLNVTVLRLLHRLLDTSGKTLIWKRLFTLRSNLLLIKFHNREPKSKKEANIIADLLSYERSVFILNLIFLIKCASGERK